MRTFFSILILVCSNIANANNDLRWFEIEVLIYDRLNNKTIPMVTEQPVAAALPHNTVDWISPLLHPDLSMYRAATHDCSRPWLTQPLPVIEDVYTGLETLDNLYNPIQTEQLEVVTSNVPPALQLNTEFSAFDEYKECRWQAIQRSQSIEESYTQPLASTPQKLASAKELHVEQPYILPANNNTFNDVFSTLSKSYGYRPLLHVSWRQPVEVGRKNGIPYRLYAGTRFMAVHEDDIQHSQQSVEDPDSPSSVAQVRAIEEIEGIEDIDVHAFFVNTPSLVEPSEDDSETLDTQLPFIEYLQEALVLPSPAIDILREKTPADEQTEAEAWKPSWQIDGWFKVFLQYVGRVPYLHIESELDYAVEEESVLTLGSGATQNNTVLTEKTYTLYPFKQLRRVISTQMHYFDHPMFGMIVQIRRYAPPVEDSNVDGALTPSE